MTDLVEKLEYTDCPNKDCPFDNALADDAGAEIERLQARNELLEHEIDVQCSSEYVEKILKRNELLEKVAEDADDVMNYPDIREFLGSEMCQTFNKNRAALAASKEQT